jgi:hypothetical protein
MGGLYEHHSKKNAAMLHKELALDEATEGGAVVVLHARPEGTEALGLCPAEEDGAPAGELRGVEGGGEVVDDEGVLDGLEEVGEHVVLGGELGRGAARERGVGGRARVPGGGVEVVVEVGEEGLLEEEGLDVEDRGVGHVDEGAALGTGCGGALLRGPDAEEDDAGGDGAVGNDARGLLGGGEDGATEEGEGDGREEEGRGDEGRVGEVDHCRGRGENRAAAAGERGACFLSEVGQQAMATHCPNCQRLFDGVAYTKKTGSGTFGDVYAACNDSDVCDTAIKDIVETDRGRAGLLCELLIAMVMGEKDVGPKVVGFAHDTCKGCDRHNDKRYHLYIRMECANSSLRSITRERENQLGELIGRMWAAGVTHHDLKPGNVLVMGDGSLRICDYGMAVWAEEADESFRERLKMLECTEEEAEEAIASNAAKREAHRTTDQHLSLLHYGHAPKHQGPPTLEVQDRELFRAMFNHKRGRDPDGDMGRARKLTRR